MSATPVEPLAPCRAVTQSGSTNADAVHARAPRDQWLTCCGRTVPRWTTPVETTTIGCRICRTIVAAITDRRTRGLPERCYVLAEAWWHSRRRVLCEQPIEGHRLRPDLDYSYPWHDGVELPAGWDEGDDT